MNAPRSLRASLLFTVTAMLLFGCAAENAPDAQGNFEAEAVTVSSEVGGQLLRFAVEEGDRLPKGALNAPSSRSLPSPEQANRPAVVGLVDTTRLAIQRRELRARRRAVRAKMASVAAEVKVLAEQLQAARRELKRVRTLREGDAAPERKVDQAEDEVRVLKQRIEATRTQKANLVHEIEAIDEQIAQVEERIQKSWITNPVTGTVLTTYVEAGEVVRTGEPLYKIASLDTLTLRAYVSGAQLSDVKLGQQVRVLVDESEETRQAHPGRVTWIADEAEFTPTPIQTKEERVDFVYAVKIRVPNPNGALKIGMPADVMFAGNGTVSDTTTAEL